MKAFVFLFIVVALSVCTSTPPARPPVKQISFWPHFKSIPLDRRILSAPPELISYLNDDNAKQGWPNRPTPADLTGGVRERVAAMFRALPEGVKAKVTPYLVGIFFVRDLGGTGYTDYVFDDKGAPVGAFVVFDELVLRRKANDWATWKENSPFAAADKRRLQVRIESDADNSEIQALQFIALHELGHVASLGGRIHPRWDDASGADPDPEHFEFSRLSWLNLKTSRFDPEFPLRSKVHFYQGKLNADPAEVWRALERTNFPTLYSATNPFDDFADSFASYVHVVLLKKPYKVSFRSAENGPEEVHTPCWGQERCRRKEDFLRAFVRL